MDLGATGPFFRPCKGLEEGVSALAALPTPRKRQWRDLKGALWGADLLEWTIRVYERWSATLPLKLYN